MTTKVSKWGNSYGVRIPKSLMDSLGIKENTEVEFIQKKGSLVMQPKKVQKEEAWRKKYPHYSLKEMIAQIDPNDQHPETDWGTDVGNEIVE